MTSKSCKASENIAADAVLQAEPAHPFVSRGGVKLAGALEQYPLDIEDHVCLDVGASTGGFTEVLLANGASLVFSIDVGRGQLHPSLHGHPRIVSMEETDIRSFDSKRLPQRPDIVVIDVSFISLKAVLPVALSLAAAPMHLLALIKPQFEAQRKHSKRGIIRDAIGASGGLRRHRRVRSLARLHRHRGVSVLDHRRRRQYRILHRRAPWLNASPSTMSAIAATASASAGGESLFVPYTLGGETVEAEPVAGHPDRRQLPRIEHASAERIAPFCRYFGACGGCAIQHWQPEAYRAWKRAIVVDTLAHAGIECEVDALIDAHGAGRRRITVHARRGSDGVLRTGFAAASSHAIVAIDDCPILDPALRGALDAARALAAALAAGGQAARYPGHRGQQRPRRRCARLGTADSEDDRDPVRHCPSARAGAADTPWRAGADADAAGDRDRHRAGEPCRRARSCRRPLPARKRWRHWWRITASAPNISPTCFAASARSHCGSRPARGFRRSTAMPARSRRCRRLSTSASGLKPIKAEARDLFRRPLMPQELRDYDAVVFDPPRQGAQAQVRQLAASKIPVVIAVSCNVATFARDARDPDRWRLRNRKRHRH